jgi:hypothetical protein
VGTSTSGQAARTLGREAGIGLSRTLASLNWRIAHGDLRLSERHVAVLDEAAMADDAALVAFLEAARVARAKVVAVGDPRQLGAVGPGGGFEALLARFGDAVHVLADNVRQRDPAERVALEELRSGDVEAAVSWYADTGRIAVSPDRDTALDAVVAGWAADVAHGAEAAMYAWRRANVAELNSRGRAAWEALGRLSGPELVVGERSYRVGDRIVALAPGASGEVVTSECGTVMAVDLHGGALVARMDDDGRLQRFGGQDLDADHLAHGYALTVHRSQGATVERAHALEDGGGRELAYVKMSRAKETSTVYAVADSLDQAVEDLRWRWAQSRRIGWAIDTGTPAPGARAPEPAADIEQSMSASLRHARLVAERDALAAVVPDDVARDYDDAQVRVRQLERQLAELDRGEGERMWRDTPVGEAAVALRHAQIEHRCCLSQATTGVGLRERWQLRRQAQRALEQQGPLREAFERLAEPARDRIRAELPEAKERLAELEDRYYARMAFQLLHPEALPRLERLDHQIATASYEMDLQRRHLDGIASLPPPPPPEPARLGRELGLGLGGPDIGLGL